MMNKKSLRIAFFGDSLTEGIVGASYFIILQRKLPQHDLYNFGKGGDTVISLYRRLHQLNWDKPLDLGFLWIGLNDVFVKTSWFFPLRKRLRRQPWTKSHTQFREYYHSLLALLKDKIPHIFTIPPLLIGEDYDNVWNEELTVLSKIIHDLSGLYPNVDFVRLREHFIPQLIREKNPPYIPKGFFRVVRDNLFVEAPEESEKKASEQGLHFTIDGVHLNKEGAAKVADIFFRKIKDFS